MLHDMGVKPCLGQDNNLENVLGGGCRMRRLRECMEGAVNRSKYQGGRKSQREECNEKSCRV